VNSDPQWVAVPGGRHIATSLSLRPSETVGFADVADELARATSSASALSARQPDGGFSAALTELVAAQAELRKQVSAAAVFDLAPRALCQTRIFDRVLVSRVRGSTWSPQTLYACDETGQVVLELDGVLEDLNIALASPLVEAEVVRRRLPALITDAQHEPRTHRPLVERTGTREYVVAPIVASSAVVGLLHADRRGTTEALSEVHRDLLRLYADAVGLSIERAELAERAQRQQATVTEAYDAAFRSVTELCSGPALQLGATPPIGSARPAGARSRGRAEEPRESARMARLTSREREVLALLASGATNAQLADQLTVAESTVKSHVKHILHKLGAANRAAAISYFMRETRTDERRTR
jgi:DNA-binding CsgD family transcriptional regulator